MFVARGKYRRLVAENESLRGDVARAQRRQDQTQTHTAALEKNLRDETADHHATRSRMDEIEVAAADTARRLEAARTHNGDLTAEVAKLKASLVRGEEERRARGVQTAGEISELQARNRALTEEGDRLRGDNKRLEEAADRALVELDQALANLAKMEAAIEGEPDPEVADSADPIRAALASAREPVPLAWIIERVGREVGWREVKGHPDVRTTKGPGGVNVYDLGETTPPSERL